MAFFKDLSKKITEGVQDASEKASELVEVQKLNTAINKEKSAIDAVKRQIGDKVFAMYQSGEPLPDILSADVQTITTHLQAITGMEAKILEIKGETPSVAQSQPQTAVPAAPPQAQTDAPSAQPQAQTDVPVAPPQAQIDAPAAPPQAQIDAPAAPPPAPVTEAQPAVAVKFCPECGAKQTEGSAFCGECGTKV
ncbi:MAG: hypothetical protein GX847_07170 [Clostridiales bacterium]|nr:hypothetical protein [Clostridiales bacterium]